MRIVCVGGGPAGLHFAIAAKLRDPQHEITVLERDAAGSTSGWGVTFGEDLLDLLHWSDPVSARAVAAACVQWHEREIRLSAGKPARYGAYGYSLNRSALVEILAERATGLDVQVLHQRPVNSRADLGDADLVVAADGGRSRLRQAAAAQFGTTVTTGRNYYLWLGTEQQFSRLTMVVADTTAGPIWFQAYPSTPQLSTCVIECSPETWHGLGMDTASADEALGRLAQAFAAGLGGHRLIGGAPDRPATWMRFDHVTNRVWYADNLVLIGDAAHTTHFSLASGTQLALHDGAVLARALSARDDLPAALAGYDRKQQERLAPVQRRALESMRWFENLPFDHGMDALAFGHSILRRGTAPPPPRWRLQVHQTRAVRALERWSDARYQRRAARSRARGR